MSNQLEIDFTHTRENNTVSQAILDNNRKRFNGQVRLVMVKMAYGMIIDGDKAYGMGIKHLPRRIKDISDKYPDLKPKRNYDSKTGVAHYYFDEFQKIQAIKILKNIK